MRYGHIKLTKRQVEELLAVVNGRKKIEDVHANTRIAIEQQLWSAYADTHPEDGPFK